MQNTIPTLGTISWGCRLMRTTAALGLLLVFGFAQTALAQTNPLNIFKNYFVTGDYVVGGWVKGSSNGTLATGTINIPDTVQGQATGVPSPGVPVGADIVAAFLYWETVESTSQAPNPGKNGFFNGYAISGSFLPSATPNAPTSWSNGGCSGSAQGAKTIQGYRADVRPFLPVDANGKVQGNGPFQVQLADTGTNGAKVPFTLGATLVIIYRVQSPLVPLNSIVLYDGTFAPSNTSSPTPEMSQQIAGFYQAAASPLAKITHIVGGGQPKKSESVLLNGMNLPSLYSDPTNPLPGIYNGSWDNPPWPVNTIVHSNDSLETTSVVPAATNGNCLDWGALVFSTTVEDTNHDGLLAAWKANVNPGPGYTDVISNQFVALPGASPTAQDIFVEVDYLTLRDSTTGTILHSHLPKHEALDKVGDAFWRQNVHVHFDVGTNYNGQTVCKLTPQLPNQQVCPDPYIIQGGTGGNEIPESAVVCTDSKTTLCQIPGQAAVGWKGGFLFVKNNATLTLPNNTIVPLGNFQFGRKDSYHYVLFGHALGEPRSFWTSFAATLPSTNTSVARLISIGNSGTTATVKIQTPQGLVKPGDCNAANPPPACIDANGDRVTIAGAIGHPALNGTYRPFTIQSQTTDPNTNVTATTFTITTAGVADGAYEFSCLGQALPCFNESRLAVTYGGPTSSGGHSDVGGGDSAVTFGLWRTDDPSNCQPDPSQPLTSQNPTYCNDQVGDVTPQAGTLLHEMGHTFFLTHGGTFFPNPVQGQQINNPPFFPPSYGLNCNPGFLSSMNYLFQIRGFPDGGIDYSGQTLPNLDETALDETLGIGSALFTNSASPAAHFTRWYAPPNALDRQIGNFATRHCDGTPITDGAQMVRVDGSTFSAPIDWNNDGNTTDTGLVQDVNFNDNFFNSPGGTNVDSPFTGFNDWINVDLRQVGSRANTFGFSDGSTADLTGLGGSTADLTGLGGSVNDLTGLGGSTADLSGLGGSTADLSGLGGSTEQDADTACSTADPPTGLMAAMSSKSVILNWTAPGGPCQVRRYDIWRATGSFPTLASVLAAVAANPNLFTDLTPKGLTGTPPVTTFTDNSKLQNNTTYTYFVTDTNAQGATSRASDPKTILVRF